MAGFLKNDRILNFAGAEIRYNPSFNDVQVKLWNLDDETECVFHCSQVMELHYMILLRRFHVHYCDNYKHFVDMYFLHR